MVDKSTDWGLNDLWIVPNIKILTVNLLSWLAGGSGSGSTKDTGLKKSLLSWLAGWSGSGSAKDTGLGKVY